MAINSFKWREAKTPRGAGFIVFKVTDFFEDRVEKDKCSRYDNQDKANRELLIRTQVANQGSSNVLLTALAGVSLKVRYG